MKLRRRKPKYVVNVGMVANGAELGKKITAALDERAAWPRQPHEPCDGCRQPLRRPVYQCQVGDKRLRLHDHYCLRIWIAMNEGGR